jgi:hypothetical protein
MTGAYFSEDHGHRFFSGGINMAFGALLLFGRTGFARVWRVIHPMGDDEENEESVTDGSADDEAQGNR